LRHGLKVFELTGFWLIFAMPPSRASAAWRSIFHAKRGVKMDGFAALAMTEGFAALVLTGRGISPRSP
jgi:hypothetical protein